MEKKTIGGFIAALRKANGMTQRDLAERLNVSDKTISRWECDEGTPDLSLIPVIAEIFDVTCDELLRGQRKSPEERGGSLDGADTTRKGEKQRQRLLKSTLSHYKNQSYIAMGISVTGFLVALICNFAFLRAVLGFLCGAIFFAASILCQVIFINRSFFSVEDADLDESDLSTFRKKVILLAEQSIGVTVGFFGSVLPLAFVDAYFGLTVAGYLLWGVIGAVLLLLLFAVVCYFLNAAFIKNGVYTLEEKEAAVYHHNHRLKKKSAIILAILLVVTFLGHQAATVIDGPWTIMDGTTFQDYESFITFMEQDIPSPTDIYGDLYSIDVSSKLLKEEINDEEKFYDENGNEISVEETLHCVLKDKDGKIVCEYTARNETVRSIEYKTKSGTILPITVYTQEDYDEASVKVDILNVIFGGVYCIEVVAVLLFYFKKRAK